MKFKWHEAKRLATIRKHGIDFVDAIEIFAAEHQVFDARSDTEPRKIAVGELNGIEIAVVFTIRGDTIRIITARRARRNERKRQG